MDQGHNEHNELLPHLQPETGGTGAASSSDAVVVPCGSAQQQDLDDGYRVRRGPQGEWELPTEEERAQLKAHDADTQREAKQQEMADEDAYQRYMASKARSWDYWAFHNAMHHAEAPLRKRVRIAVVVVGTTTGTVAEGVLQGDMAEKDKVMVTFGVEELVQDLPQREAGAEESDRTVPASPGLAPQGGDGR